MLTSLKYYSKTAILKTENIDQRPSVGICNVNCFFIVKYGIILSTVYQTYVCAVYMCVTELFSLPDDFGVLADDLQLEHISALSALDQSERHL